MMLGSCLKNSDDDNTRYVSGYFTIDGNANDGYTLYQDGGGILKPSTMHLLNEIGKDGFGKNERAMLYFSFEEKNLTPYEDGIMITEAEIQSGKYLPLVMPISAAEAEEKGQVQSDSSFAINQFSNIWIYRGYVNVTINANASIKGDQLVAPLVNMVYDPEKIADNKIDFTVLYNRRTGKETNSTAIEISNSFPIYKMADMIPGNDSVSITIHAEGAKPKDLKIARVNLRKGNYVPYNK